MLSPNQHFSHISGKIEKFRDEVESKHQKKNLSHSLFNTRGEVQLRKNLSSFRILKTNGEKRNIFSRIFIHILYIKNNKYKMASNKLNTCKITDN